jgi:hypothetical protein
MADTPDTARLAEIRDYASQTRRRAKGRHVGSDIIDELLDHIDTLGQKLVDLADQEFLLDQNQWYHAEQQRLMAELDDLRNEMNADRESTRRSIVRRLNAESERDALKREINLLRSTWAPPEDDSVGMF